MRYHPYPFSVAILVIAASCSITEPEGAETGPVALQKEITITATSGEPDTRTERAADGSVLWSPGDKISLFYGSGADGGSCFTAQNTETAKTVNFTGTIGVITGGNNIAVEDTYFWAVYPYNATASCDGNSITTVLPSEQVATADTFADDLFPSMGRSQGLNMAFYNICGGIKFTVSEEGIKSVTLKGNSGEQIAGTITANFDSNNLPAVTNIADGSDTITLSAPEGETLVPGKAYYIVLVPTVFESGFTLTFSKGSTCAHKEFTSTITIRRSVFGTMTTPDKDLEWEEDVAAQLALEREALIAFYNALDGDNWANNKNWCSERPIGEWYGVRTDQNGYVNCISLASNGLRGTINIDSLLFSCLRELYLENNDVLVVFPDNNTGYLNQLSSLRLRYCRMIDKIPEWLSELDNLKELEMFVSGIPTHIGIFTHLQSLDLLVDSSNLHIPEGIGELHDLYSLNLYASSFPKVPLGGVLPSSIGNLSNLVSLCIGMGCQGEIPTTLGNLTSLGVLNLEGNHFSGEMPSSLGNLTRVSQFNLSNNNLCGRLPDSICNLRPDFFLINNNRLSGPLPDGIGGILDSISLGNSPENAFNISCNGFTGIIPKSVTTHPKWGFFWWSILSGNLLMTEDPIPGPHIYGIDINGVPVDSDVIYANNTYTILYQYDPSLYPILYPRIEVIQSIFNKYKEKGVHVIAWGTEADTIEQDRQFISEHNIEEWTFLFAYDRAIYGHSHFPTNHYPYIMVINSEGNIVMSTLNQIKENDLTFFFDSLLGIEEIDYYCSNDYTTDGVTTTLQPSTSVSGIDLVLMGDAFSDRQIADGTYGNVMQKAMNAFFSEEPYKSMKDYFNVYTVNVVSATEGYEHGGQALATGHGIGTYVYGNDNKVVEYARKAIGEDRMDDALIIVMMNEDAYAGTCFMYNPPSGNYGRGLSIAYFPVSSDEATFNGLVSHEAGGHGFAKLADEYAYEYNGAISDDAIANTRVNETYGWWKNVDFTNDPSQVKWSQFLNDERYAGEGLGCYEGGLTYWTGVWRPTENSIMRYNTGGFNAPSRYAIWYRINKLAYGESWNGTYEDFVAFDAPNRTPAAAARRAAKHANYVEKQFQPLAPPVVVGHSWKEALAK